MPASTFRAESGQSRRPWASVVGAGGGVTVFGGALVLVVGAVDGAGRLVVAVAGVFEVGFARVEVAEVLGVVEDVAVFPAGDFDAVGAVALVTVDFGVAGFVVAVDFAAVDGAAVDFAVEPPAFADGGADTVGAEGLSTAAEETLVDIGGLATVFEASTPVRADEGAPLTAAVDPDPEPVVVPLDLLATRKITPMRTATTATMRATRRIQ